MIDQSWYEMRWECRHIRVGAFWTPKWLCCRPHHFSTRPLFDHGNQNRPCQRLERGRIHGKTVVDGWTGAVMRKPLEIHKCDGLTDRRTDGQTNTARCRVASATKKAEFYLCIRKVDNLKIVIKIWRCWVGVAKERKEDLKGDEDETNELGNLI